MDCNLFHNSLPDQKQEEEESIIPNLDAIDIFGLSGGSKPSRGQKHAHNTYTADKYQREAYMTWKNYYHPDDDSQAVRNYINGTLSCFCDDEYTRMGFWSALHEYRSDGND